MYLIVLSIILGVSSLLVPSVINQVVRLLVRPDSTEEQLYQEIAGMKRQLQTISMVDEFVCYAKLQRKINALSSQLKSKVGNRSMFLQKLKLITSVTSHVVLTVVSLCFIWYNRHESVLSFNEEVWWPLSFILALPSCESGQVSLIIWFAIVRLACSRIGMYCLPSKLKGGSLFSFMDVQSDAN